MSPKHPDNDRESLSALFDGELHGEAARFALKRLGHDAEWQQACGSWQLIGDVLRGRGTSAASGDFAGRVADAVAQEPPVVMLEFARLAQPVRRMGRWAGAAALAASVAFAALFVARSPSPVADEAGASTQLAVADTPAAAASAVAASPSVDTTPVVMPPTPAAEPRAVEPALPSRSIAAAPRPAQRYTRTRAVTGTPRAARAAVARATAVLAANESAPAASAQSGSDPFRPAQEIVTRPWPRAVLPNSQAAGALTASFDSPASASPSFYPFEPRLPAEPALLPAPPQP